MGMTENSRGAAEDQPKPHEQQPSQPTAVPSEPPSPWAANTSAAEPAGQPWQPQPAGQPYPGFQQQGAGTPDPGQPGALQGAPGEPGTHPLTGPQPYYAMPGQQYPQLSRPKAPGRGKVVAGVAALVLAVGGVAGGVGGYIGYEAASGNGSVSNALNVPKPIQNTSNAVAGSVEDVAQKVLPTVVQLRVDNGEGSGIVLSSDGLILTNNHVVESAANGGDIKVVFQDGKTATATILGRDPSSDLAVVKAKDVSNLTIAQLGNSGDLKVGQQVVAVGSPFDLAGTVTSGIVSSLNRPVRAGGEQGTQASVLDAIQTDAAINPGNSGGPLVNMQGQVVGINSAIYSPNSSQQSQGGSVGIGFAIPIDQAQRTAKQITTEGKVTQTVLGVKVVDAKDGGAQVQEVVAGGAAEQAGLKVGDVITKFGDRKIESSDALVAAVRSKAPNEKVQLTVGTDKNVEVTLGGQAVESK